MERFYYDACACITGSNATHSLVKKQLNDKSIKVKVIHYGINFDRLYIPSSQTISEMRKKFGEKSEIVLCVGRLGLDKGHDILLYAFKKVLEKRPFAKLLIVGIGPLKNDLLDLRNSLGLESVVHFLGKVPQNVLSSYYSICDVFALPSKSENRWEGLGLVYLEANFYERPVVGGNEGGVPEAILNEQTGLVVNSRDHIAVANAIIRLLSDPEFRIKLGKIGKKRVLHYFNSDRMARETISVLNCCKQRFSYKINLKNFFLFITRYIKTLVLRILTYFLGQK